MGYQSRARQRVFVILIGVAIFCGIERHCPKDFVWVGTFDAVNHDKAELEMSSVLDFMHAVQNGFQEMKLNGIDPKTITFWSAYGCFLMVLLHIRLRFSPWWWRCDFIPVWSNFGWSFWAWTATDWSFVRNTIEGWRRNGKRSHRSFGACSRKNYVSGSILVWSVIVLFLPSPEIWAICSRRLFLRLIQ